MCFFLVVSYSALIQWIEPCPRPVHVTTLNKGPLGERTYRQVYVCVPHTHSNVCRYLLCPAVPTGNMLVCKCAGTDILMGRGPCEQ